MKKNLNKEDYPQPYYKPPKIFSIILLTSCEGEAVLSSIDKLRLGLVSNCRLEYNHTFSEGDVINIRTESDLRVDGFDGSPFFLHCYHIDRVRSVVESVLNKFF